MWVYKAGLFNFHLALAVVSKSIMALSKPKLRMSLFFTHLKTLADHSHTAPPPLLFHSFATPEEAAAERRRRRSRLHMEPPPLTSNPKPNYNNPNAPKLPEHVSAMTGKRLDIHNNILNLIHIGDLEEAHLFTRHSIYSNTKPTIYTCNSVLAAHLRHSQYSQLLSLHRFFIQAGIAPNIVTHNILIDAYFRFGKPDVALQHYNQLINNTPFTPSLTTYRILVKGLLLNNSNIQRALEIKDELLNKGLQPDPVIYSYIISALAAVEEEEEDSAAAADQVLALCDELRTKLAGTCSDNDNDNDGLVRGSLIMAYFRKSMEKEAMDCYAEAVAALTHSSNKMSSVGYNSVLEALIKYGKFDDAYYLFDKMKEAHSHPRRLTLNNTSFNIMIGAYWGQGRFEEAIQEFRNIREFKCGPDTVSLNVCLQRLCGKGKVAEAEEIFRDVIAQGKGPNPDQSTYVLLMDACFGENRVEAASEYFQKIVTSKILNPNLADYNKIVHGLLELGKIDEPKEIFDKMVERVKLDDSNCEEDTLRALCCNEIVHGLIKIGKIDESKEIFNKMVERVKLDASNYEEMLRLVCYNEIVHELIKLGKIDEAKETFDKTVKRVKLQVSYYEDILRALCEAEGKVDVVYKVVNNMLDDESLVLSSDMNELVREAFRKVGWEEELDKLLEQKEANKKKRQSQEASGYSSIFSTSSILANMKIFPHLQTRI